MAMPLTCMIDPLWSAGVLSAWASPRAADSLQKCSLEDIYQLSSNAKKNGLLIELDPSPQLVHPSCDHLANNPDLELQVRPQSVSQKSTGPHVGLSTCVVGADSPHA